MRIPLLLSLLTVACLLPTKCWAGKLSRARNAVRSSDVDEEKSDPEPEPRGKLAAARREVKQVSHRKKKDRHPNHQRSGNRHGHGHSHGNGWLGFSFSRHDPYCLSPASYCSQPVVVQNFYPIVHPQPAQVTPGPVASTYTSSPIQPSVVESFARRFPPYPYAEDCDGCLVTASPSYGDAWLGRVQYEFGSDSQDLDRNGIGFLLEHTSRFGIDFDWDSYSEELPGGEHDELHVGEFNFLYRVAESDHLLMRAGIGVGWLGDRFGTEAGVNFTIKAEYMPCRPFVLASELDFGTLGDAENFHAAGSIGAMIGRCEVYGGYDYRRIGEVEIEGPQIGLRFWF